MAISSHAVAADIFFSFFFFLNKPMMSKREPNPICFLENTLKTKPTQQIKSLLFKLQHVIKSAFESHFLLKVPPNVYSQDQP